MNNIDLKTILEKHKMWLNDEDGGEMDNLSGADLRGANLRWADLRWGDLSGADLSVVEIASHIETDNLSEYLGIWRYHAQKELLSIRQLFFEEAHP